MTRSTLDPHTRRIVEESYQNLERMAELLDEVQTLRRRMTARGHSEAELQGLKYSLDEAGALVLKMAQRVDRVLSGVRR